MAVCVLVQTISFVTIYYRIFPFLFASVIHVVVILNYSSQRKDKQPSRSFIKVAVCHCIEDLTTVCLACMLALMFFSPHSPLVKVLETSD